MNVQWRRKRGRPNRRWLDNVKDDIKQKILSWRKYTTVLHGGVYYHTSTPHKSGNKMNRKKKLYFTNKILHINVVCTGNEQPLGHSKQSRTKMAHIYVGKLWKRVISTKLIRSVIIVLSRLRRLLR